MDSLLGTRATFMLDLVVVAMVLVIPVMLWSIYDVRVKKNFVRHKWVMSTLVVVLAITVTLFEIDIRLNGWEQHAVQSVFYSDPWYFSPIGLALIVHLFFAITTTMLWAIVSIRAWRNFAKPPRPGVHSRFHVHWARLAAVDMILTAVTGWGFYWMAFVA